MRSHPHRLRRQARVTAPPPCSARTAAALATLTVVLVLAATGAASAHPGPRTSLADIEQEVMCPTCGTPLMVAQSPLADRERAFIEHRIALGETKAQIEHEMVAQFGPAILATPPASGFDLTAYLVPAAGFALALIGLALGLRRWRRRTAAAPADLPPPLAPALRGRLDEDMARYDG